MPLLPWEKTLTCPYNIAHQITQERMQKHLVSLNTKLSFFNSISKLPYFFLTIPMEGIFETTSHYVYLSQLKCRRNHPDSEVVICEYNASHHIQKVMSSMYCNVASRDMNY